MRSKAILAAHIDAPREGSELEGSRLSIAGWVLGRAAQAVAVEVLHNGRVIRVTSVHRARQDVAVAHPDVREAESSGFHAFVDVAELPHEFKLLVRAVMADNDRAPIGLIRGRYAVGPSSDQQSVVPSVSVSDPEWLWDSGGKNDLRVSILDVAHTPQYQTFPDSSGESDSSAKLDRLQLPANLSGGSVLDIGCNEGFFCQEAWRRGAGRVVGIDKNAGFIERARLRDSDTDYRVMDWTDLEGLDETFDLILLLSSLHYAADPEALLRLVVDLLNPDGTLVLECGIAPGTEAKRVRVERAADVVQHLTEAMLLEILKDADVHHVGHSVDHPDDPAGRHVFHVKPRRPTALSSRASNATAGRRRPET